MEERVRERKKRVREEIEREEREREESTFPKTKPITYLSAD